MCGQERKEPNGPDGERDVSSIVLALNVAMQCVYSLGYLLVNCSRTVRQVPVSCLPPAD